ncbi:MAG: TolC family protein [Steroidobacteraceae bacterium]|nr:TolC family protein [Deltaproteobacteria bacterium]
MRVSYILTAILLLMAGQALAGQTLSVKEAISRALEKNNLVRAAGFNATAARQGVAVVASRYYPALSFEETLAASNAPTQTFMMKLDQGRFTQNDLGNLNHPNTVHDFKTQFVLQQPLYLPSLAPLKKMAAKDAEKSELELEATRQNIAFQTFSLYLDLQKSVARLQAIDRSVSDARENLRLAKVRTAAGVGLRSDELRAGTHHSLVEQQLITFRNNLILARMRLAIMIGLPEDTEFDIPATPDKVSVPLQSDETVRSALENRIELKQSRTELEKSAAAVRLAGSDYLPALGAFASYQLNGKDAPFAADNDAWAAGVTLKWQLFDGFRRDHERYRAIAGRSAAQEMLENSLKDARYQIKESLLRREEAGKRLEVAFHARQDAEETVRLISKRFENSLSTMVELLDAQTVLDQVRANLVETEADHALAGGRVYYSSGTFVKEMLK